MAYQIITDGSCDLGQEIPQKAGLKVVPFYVTFDGKTYKKEIEEIGVREFYQQMVDNLPCHRCRIMWRRLRLMSKRARTLSVCA